MTLNVNVQYAFAPTDPEAAIRFARLVAGLPDRRPRHVLLLAEHMGMRLSEIATNLLESSDQPVWAAGAPSPTR